MKPDYLTLNDGTVLRVEINWNAVSSWSSITGSDIKGLKDLESNVSLLRTIAWCAAAEGERLDGREFNMHEIDFGGKCSFYVIADFIKIIGRQLHLTATEKKNSKETAGTGK